MKKNIHFQQYEPPKSAICQTNEQKPPKDFCNKIKLPLLQEYQYRYEYDCVLKKELRKKEGRSRITVINTIYYHIAIMM